MEFSGLVVEGKHLGRTLGFPTLNIDAAGAPLPERGVYIASVRVEGVERPFRCMLNIGSHPTVPEGPPTVEAHLLGIDRDFYGARVRVETLEYLREERRFASVEQLREQLERDRERVRAYFAQRDESAPEE